MNLEKFIQLNNQSAGRDKIARFVQYSSRAAWSAIEQSKNGSPALADNFKTLEYILSTFRKSVLRFGRSLDVFYGSLRTIHYSDIVIRITLTVGKLSQSLFLFADHLMWLARTGLFKNINTKKWGDLANKYWLFSIIMNLCRDVYEIYRLVDLHNAGIRGGIRRPITTCSKDCLRSPMKAATQSYSMMLGHKDVVVDTVKNVCDFFIPFTALGYTQLSPRTIGILGAISSLAGLIALVEPTAKLTPA